MLRALQTWPYQGVPENPAAWLFRMAHNAAMDAIRHENVERNRRDVAEPMDWDPGPRDDDLLEEQLRDDELRMIFMCCHPAIPRDSSVALSLKTAGGFSVREIARAFSDRGADHCAAAGARQAPDSRTRIELRYASRSGVEAASRLRCWR